MIACYFIVRKAGQSGLWTRVEIYAVPENGHIDLPPLVQRLVTKYVQQLIVYRVYCKLISIFLYNCLTIVVILRGFEVVLPILLFSW